MRGSSQIDRRRTGTGTTIAEMPVALWLIIVMCFPMLVLATSSIRFAFFWNAAREAATQASKCPTFQNDTSVGISAINTADLWATRATSGFPGITVTPPVNVYIVQTNVVSGITSRGTSRQRLASAADTDNNIFDIQVEISGQIEPLLRVQLGGLSIPGLTDPFPVVVRSQSSVENPQGLDK